RRGRGGRTAGRGRRWLDAGPGRRAPPVGRPGGARRAEKSHGPRAAGGGTGREGLVTPSLVVLLALQVAATPLDVTARVDRARVVLGDEIGLTVRARARTAEPVSLELPPLAGFLVLSTHEVIDVSVGGPGAPVRTTVRELQLRATKVGTLLIGAVHARRGRVIVTTDPIVGTVDSGAAGGPPALTPLARAPVDAAPRPQPFSSRCPRPFPFSVGRSATRCRATR